MTNENYQTPERIYNLLKDKMSRTDIEVIKANYKMSNIYDGNPNFKKNVKAHFDSKTRFEIEKLDPITRFRLKLELNSHIINKNGN